MCPAVLPDRPWWKGGCCGATSLRQMTHRTLVVFSHLCLRVGEKSTVGVGVCVCEGGGEWMGNETG